MENLMDNAALVKILFSIQGAGFLSLLGVYIWSFKLSQSTDAKIAKVYDTLNKHIQKTNIHQDDSDFVRTEVFETVHTQLVKDVTEIKGDVKELIKKAG
jgi:hypothetical protein